MTHTNSEWLEHQLRRWMRPDAHRFVRPDWRRYVRPGFEQDHPFALYERKYRPDQPRVPAGNPDGGEWTADASGQGLLSASNAIANNKRPQIPVVPAAWPSNGPPEIPKDKPLTSSERTRLAKLVFCPWKRWTFYNDCGWHLLAYRRASQYSFIQRSAKNTE